MKALTLHPEWIVPILSDHPAAKRTENRTWRLPSTAVNVPVALHSGARIGGGSGWRPGDTTIVGSRWRNRPPQLSARASMAGASAMDMVATAKAAGWPIMDRWRRAIELAGRSHEVDRLDRIDAQLHAIASMAHVGHVVAVVWFSGCDQQPTTAWDVTDDGWWYWRISGVTPLLQPIPCQGHEQLWPLPDPVRDAVREQLLHGRIA